MTPPVSDNARSRVDAVIPQGSVMLSIGRGGRFAKLIDFRPDGCWIWLGSTRTRKYKNRRYRYGTYSGQLAHRLAFQATYGSIPNGFELDHRCQNKLCVNPAHLEVVSHQLNCERRPKSGPGPTPGSVRWRKGLYDGRKSA